MNGAQALLQTLADAGIEVCFTNPGTSEMHFVAALDGEPRMRAVLALFEGVATGAADGYARMAGKPAATLLHLAVVCAEDMPRFTPALVASDASPLTRALGQRMPGMCAAMNVPPVPDKEPTPIAAPALLLSGALDPVTPPHRAASAARFMPHAQSVTVTNVGHGVSQLGCAPRLLRTFLDQPGAKLDAACLEEIPPPTFQLGSAGPQP